MDYEPPMNDTTAPKRGWFQRLTEWLSRSSKQMTEQVVSTFVKRPLDQAAIDELEEQLIEADLGPAAAARVAERFKALRFGKAADEIEIKESLAEAIAAVLDGGLASEMGAARGPQLAQHSDGATADRLRNFVEDFAQC